MEIDLIGDVPSSPKDVIFASCDEKYFYDHAPALIASCCLSNNSLHLHIINPRDEIWTDSVMFKEKTQKLTMLAIVLLCYRPSCISLKKCLLWTLIVS